jgi:diguanylate cyclase (GGDEF)-like protein/PAS domain S-box-containing protein
MLPRFDEQSFASEMLAALPLGLMVLENGVVVWANPMAAELLGMPDPEAVLGLGPEDFISLRLGPGNLVRPLNPKPDGNQLVQSDWTIQRPDGSTFAGHLKVHPLGQDRLLVTLSDISWRKQMEQSVRESEERLTAILESVSAGIVVIDPENHSIVDINPVALQMIGRERREVIGHVCHLYICPAEQGKCPITDLGQSMDNAERVLLDHEGHEIPILKTVVKVRLNGRLHLLESFLDITRLKELEGKLKRLAATDSLTGLLNRRHLLSKLSQEMERAARYNEPLSLLMLDVDHFKSINDRFGHPAGDQALRHLADHLLKNKRGSDLAGRLGGEEFALVLVETDLETANKVAERLRCGLAAMTVRNNGQEFSFTVSVGVAQFAGSDEDIESLMKRADRALYQAKEQGRDQCVAAPPA